MSEHIRFEAVIEEAKSFLAVVEDNLDRVWEEWSPYCVYRDDSGILCSHNESKNYAYRNDSGVSKHSKLETLCAFENCPYINDRPQEEGV